MARYIEAERLLFVLDKNFGHTGGAVIMEGLIDMARNRCVRRPRFDVIYNDAHCPDCEIIAMKCVWQDLKEHLDGFVHCKKEGVIK